MRWPLTYYSVLTKFLLPYICYLLVFTFYTLYDLETSYEDYARNIEDPKPYSLLVDKLAIICRVVIILFTLYFFLIELMGMFRVGLL
jgi:hypothetical protein